jgi:GNAT superfamily N-acetyltransferase
MVVITPLKGSFQAAAPLLNDALGPGTYTPQSVQELAEDPRVLLLGAWKDDVLVGVSGARLLDENLSFYDAFGSGAAVLRGKRVGSLQTSALVPAARGQGIGKRLAEARLAWLRENGCEYAVGIAWISGLAHTSRPVFERLGFVPLGESSDVFRELSTREGWSCVVCGHPCVCPAILYGRALSAPG